MTKWNDALDMIKKRSKLVHFILGDLRCLNNHIFIAILSNVIVITKCQPGASFDQSGKSSLVLSLLLV